MKPNRLNMEAKDDCGNNEAKPLNGTAAVEPLPSPAQIYLQDDTEQQPDCSDNAVQLASDRFEISENIKSQQPMKQTPRKSVKDNRDKDQIKNDIKEIRSLLPPLCSSDKKQTHHELLQHTITFIRLLLAQNSDIATSIDSSKDIDYNKLKQENEELRAQNKHFRSVLATIGMPENISPSQLEVTWRIREDSFSSEDHVFGACSGSVLREEHAANKSAENSTAVVASANQRTDDNLNHDAQEKELPRETNISNVHQDIYESTCVGSDLVEDAIMGLAPPRSSDMDLTADVPSASMVVSSTDSHPVFMSPDSGLDRQTEMDKTISQLPPIQSNGNLSDISEPTSDVESNDPPPLLTAVRRLALENALLQTSMGIESMKTANNAFKVDDRARSLGLLHGNMPEDMSQRYIQMMQPVGFSTPLSSSMDPLLGISSTSSRFSTSTTCPISPNISESSINLSTSSQMNNVMMLPSGQLLLVSPHQQQQSTNSSILHGSEPSLASVMPNTGTSTLAVHSNRQEINVSIQHQQQTGLFATNFNLNQGLSLGNQTVNGMTTVSASNTVFMNPPIQYGVSPQQMTFFSGGQSGNILAPIIQPSCPQINHIAVAQNPTVAVNVPQGQVAMNALPPTAPQSQHPSALILPNGQIVPVVTQPNLLFPQQQCTPVTGGLLVPSIQTPNLNIISNVQNPTSQLRLGSGLIPTSTIQPTQVITNIANIRAPTYGVIQNTGQNHQPQYQIMSNSLQPIGNLSGGGILLGQPQQKDSFMVKNMNTSMPGLALPQAPGQYTVLSGSCISALTSQHPSNSGLFGGSCSTTVSTAVPLLQPKTNVFGSTASLPNIPTTLTAMLTPEGSIILAIPGCREGELATSGGGPVSSHKTQKVTQRPLMPKPASKLEVVNQLMLGSAPLAGAKGCPNIVPCEFGSPGAMVSMTSSPMLPLTVNTTTNMDICCVLSGPGSTTSSTDILAKATKSIFSISPYENLSPRSLFNSGINDGLLTFSSTGISSKNDSSNETKTAAPVKLKRSKLKPKPKSIKKKNPKNTTPVLTLDSDVCLHVVQPHEAFPAVSPNHEIVEQLQNDEEVSDINDFSDLIRMEPMTPVSQKVIADSEQPPTSSQERYSVSDPTEITDLSDTAIGSKRSNKQNEGNDAEEFIEINETDPVPGIVISDGEEKTHKLEDSVPCTVSSTAGNDIVTISAMVPWNYNSEAGTVVAIKEPSLLGRVETTSCREVGTSTERKRKKHKRQKSKVDHFTKEKKVEVGVKDEVSLIGALENNRRDSADLRNEEYKSLKQKAFKMNGENEVIVSFADSMPHSEDISENINLLKQSEEYLLKKQECCNSSKDEISKDLIHSSKTELHGACHSKLGLTKKQHKRSHKSFGFLRPEMLPDTLTFTESELLDVVDKVENMVMTDDREIKKRSCDHIEDKESRSDNCENLCRKKQKCERFTEVSLSGSCKSPPPPPKPLPWTEIPTTAPTLPGSNKNSSKDAVPDSLPGFESEDEEIVGFGLAEGFVSDSLTSQGLDKGSCSVESPVFSLELVVSDCIGRSPEGAAIEHSENVFPESSKNQENMENALSRFSSQSLENAIHQNSDDSPVGDVASNLMPNKPAVSSAGCVTSQARHSGIASLAKQVAPSKPHGSLGTGVQPKPIASKSMVKISQGTVRTEIDTVLVSSNQTQANCRDTYNENIFSNKDHYLPSSKDLGLDFALDLDSKDKALPSDVTSAYDWVLGDPEPQTLMSLDFSPPNENVSQRSFELLNEPKVTSSKRSLSSSDALLIESSVQCSVNQVVETQTTTSCHNMPSSCSSTYYNTSLQTSTDCQTLPLQTTVAMRQSPTSSNLQLTATFGSASADTASNHPRNSTVPPLEKASSCTVTTLNHSEILMSSNYPTRSSASLGRSTATVTSSVTYSSSLNQKISSMSTSVTCTTTSVKMAVASGSSSSRSSCSQKSLEGNIRSSALPHERTTSASMYRSIQASERTERHSCSKDGSLRPNSDYFDSSSQLSTSSSCAVQGRSLDGTFHYPLPPYLLNSSRDYAQVEGCLSRYSSGNYGMLSSSSCCGDYNALARYSVYFSTPFTHDLGLDVASHQRISPNQNLPSCSIEKNSSTSKVSLNNNRLDGNNTKSCQSRLQDDRFPCFPGSSHMQDIAQCGNSQFLEPQGGVSHGLVAHNHDSSSLSRSNQRLNSGIQNNCSRSHSSMTSPASDRLIAFPLHSGYSGTSVASSLASPPLHHHSMTSDRHCLSQQLGYDLMFHNPTIQTFSPNLTGVGFDPPPLNFSRDCVNNTSPHAQPKKVGKKIDDHSSSTGSKMILSHSKQAQSSTIQSELSSKSASSSGRSTRSSKKSGKTSSYDMDSGLYEGRSVTPYVGLGNMSPNFPPDGLAYMNFFGNTSRPLSNSVKTLQHRDPPAPISHPFNSSLFSSSRAQNGLGINFQTGFGMDHVNPSHITSSQMIIPHSSAISAHMHGFGFFPDISSSMVQRDALNNVPSMKFGRGPILSSQETAEPGPLQHPQTVSNAMYTIRGQLPPSHMLHDMSFNTLLGHQHAAFDARSIGGGMVHPPFGSHNHGPSFGMGHLNFPVHNL